MSLLRGRRGNLSDGSPRKFGGCYFSRLVPRRAPFRRVDISILHAPSRWTPQRLAWALLITATLAVLVLVCNFSLRRTVVVQNSRHCRAYRQRKRAWDANCLIRCSKRLTGIGVLIGNTRVNLHEQLKAAAPLTMAERMVQRASAESRASLQELMSVTLDEHGLGTALDEALRPLAQMNKAAFHLHLPKELPRLTPRVETARLRIAHKAAADARRHAQAKNVHLRLHFTSDQVCMELQDDGLGFDTAISRHGVDRHFGLLSMEERALKLKGRFEIESEHGRGTTVRVALPVAA